ncbi:MAG TPA: hypothetical protein VGN52_03530 [Burkholderiales bacterium]|jgi:hypothetical protein
MDLQGGFQRAKIVWAAACSLMGGLVVYVLSQVDGNIGMQIVGTVFTTIVLAGAPFAHQPLDQKICGGFALAWAGVCMADGKWPDGAIIGAIIGAIFAGILYGVIWVVKGFFPKKPK